MTQDDVIAEARRWKNTPFHPNAWAKGLGCDCVGMIGGIALSLGLDIGPFRRAYPLRADGTLVPEINARLVKQSGPPQPADVLLMAFDAEPHHVAIFTGETIIHSYAQARKVVEQPFSAFWASKVVAVYRFKELA